MSEYFLSFEEAYLWAEKNCHHIHIYSLGVGPQDVFDIEEIKKRTGANAICVYGDVKNWINNRFEILDL